MIIRQSTNGTAGWAETPVLDEDNIYYAIDCGVPSSDKAIQSSSLSNLYRNNLSPKFDFSLVLYI